MDEDGLELLVPCIEELLYLVEGLARLHHGLVSRVVAAAAFHVRLQDAQSSACSLLFCYGGVSAVGYAGVCTFPREACLKEAARF